MWLIILIFLVACGVPTNSPEPVIPDVPSLRDASVPEQPEGPQPQPTCRAGSVLEDQYKAYPALCFALSYTEGHFLCTYYIADQATQCKSEFTEFVVFISEDEPNTWEVFNDSGYLGTVYKEPSYSILTFTFEKLDSPYIKECTISGEALIVCDK